MSAGSLGVGEHVTTGNTQYSMVSGNNYKRILKNGPRMSRTTHSRSHSQQPRGDLLARNNLGNKVEFEPNAVLDAEDARQPWTAQPKDGKWERGLGQFNNPIAIKRNCSFPLQGGCHTADRSVREQLYGNLARKRQRPRDGAPCVS